MDAFSILNNLLHDNHGLASFEQAEMAELMRKHEAWVGPKDNPDLFSDSVVGAAVPSSQPDYLAKIRPTLLMEKAPESQINDQIALPSTDGKIEGSFRLLAAHGLPDAILFSNLMRSKLSRPPDGLQVAAALGSPAARKGFDAELLGEIDSNKALFASDTLYGHYLQALAVLFAPPDPAAPDLFRKPAWSFKSLQTALGGWVLARNVFSLQAKENVVFGGDSDSPVAGFVEPVPDFF